MSEHQPNPKLPSETGEKIDMPFNKTNGIPFLAYFASKVLYSRLSSDRRGVGLDQLRARFDIPDAAAVPAQKTGKREIDI